MLTAVMVGLCTAYFSGQAIIGLLIFFSILAAFSALGIKKHAHIVNDAVPKGLAENCGERFHPLLKGLQGLFSTSASRIFAVAAILYTFANASMLPLMVQLISRQSSSAAAVQLPSSLLLTEFVMIPVCFFASKQARMGRRPLLILSYAFLVLRGVGFTFIKTPAMLVAMQILDGISAGIFGLVITLVVADFCRHNNRFNSTLAALYMVLTLANGLSEFTSGMLANYFGFTTAFAILTAVAMTGFLIIVALLPETREATKTRLVENQNGFSVAASGT
jgi:predicted MFS family arabinose efflux permease